MLFSGGQSNKLKIYGIQNVGDETNAQQDENDIDFEISDNYNFYINKFIVGITDSNYDMPTHKSLNFYFIILMIFRGQLVKMHIKSDIL